MTVTIHLGPDTTQKLQALAAQSGESLEAYLEHLAERAVAASPEPSAWTMRVSDEEFERLLDELSAGPALPSLPL